MDNKDNNGNPLVSICTTFFNAEKYIHRLLSSCLNQTYANIELVIVDDASTDESERVIRKYMAGDPRVKYFRNDERTNIAECFLKMSNLASGDFAMIVGADDWLAKNYIEKGIDIFIKHPDIGGIIPSVISLQEHKNGVFKFKDARSFSFKLHPAKWFVRRIYKPTHLYASGYALVSTEDLKSAIKYYFDNYYRDQSGLFPNELLNFFKRVYGYDAILFLEVLSRHKKFALGGAMNYIKIEHQNNQTFDFAWGSLLEVFKSPHYYLIIYKIIFKNYWTKFYRGLKIYLGAEMLSSALVYFFKRGAKLNFSDSKTHINGFFRHLSFFEIMMAAIYAVPMVVFRSFGFARRKFITKNKYKAEKIFTKDFFLDSEKRFNING